MNAKVCRERNTGSRRAEALDALGLPPDAAGGTPVITVSGNRFVCVEGHKGVLRLSGELIRLYTPCGILRIEGNSMLVLNMDCECVRLKGKIKSVGFE
ncbi:MAG: YabP/YqfC family sporulation protein [Clostridia bacterium]|nr:YabP/YqfC family sporulation protein [Clostridia bacterium]